VQLLRLGKVLKLVAMKLRNVWLVLLVLLLLFLAVAWIDGGREEQRMIVEPVELPEIEE